ncbi:energy-coupling factor transporter ATPase [Methanoplanus limicola]|uniref:ABC transporter related protein n=1 Tax=Methanoplanus limicola DSM 2279 TaxID=937775 RepID=H1Z4K9_9EURY|nr:ABC transporter related protein [Methanoplanus limicola DSM 2279]
MKSRDIAIAGILLAIGAILRYLSNIVPGAIVANPIIALYCLAIILIAPKVKDALGIGIVAGIISAIISHSIFPPANLISEPIGALVCLGVYNLTRNRIPLSPGISTFIATLASGFSFLIISIVVIMSSIISAPGESFTFEVFVLTVSPIIILTAIANSVITQILSIPSSRILMRNSSGIPEESSFSGHTGTTAEKRERRDEFPAFRFENYSYRYPQGNVEALSEINLEIEKGEFILVNGTTGAGKTTFCLAAAGILNHEYEGTSGGRLEIFGREVLEYQDMGEIGSHIGFVFDDADAQLIFTTVEEEVLSGLENRGLDERSVRDKLEEIMDLTEISGLRYRAPHTLSGGQKQRVALAATLASGTECLILDEATAELDTEATEKIIKILSKLKSEGKTIIVVEQKPEEMSGIADRVVIIDNGRISGNYPADEYFRDYNIRKDESSAEVECAGKIFVNTAELTERNIDRTVVEFKDVTHNYGKETALDNVSLKIYKGELIAIIGENGSGKTTLSKHINGLLKPTSGEVVVAGINTAGSTVTELAKHAGLVFQNPDTMLFEDSVEKEILFGLKNTGADLAKDPDYINRILEEFGLSGRNDTFPRSMSRGERQRLAIACVTAMKPEIIILDEPTTGLDPEESLRIMNIIRRLAEDGHTVIMVSHDMKIVEKHAGRIIKMEGGKITRDISCSISGVN